MTATPHTPDMHEVLRLHIECSMRRNELIEECRRLRDAGRTRKARRALKRAEEIEERLRDLEKPFKPLKTMG